MHPFTIHPVTSVGEAVTALAQFGETAALYAGGTELLLVLKQRLARFDHLIDVKTIPELQELTALAGVLRVGAAVTHRRLERDPLVRQHLPLLAAVERRVASVRVRNVGTLGGNLCFAEPHSDLGVLAVLLDARLHLASVRGERILPVSEFLAGAFTTTREPDELLTLVGIPLLPTGSLTVYERLQHQERPTCAVGVVLTPDGDGDRVAAARIAVGCAGPQPRRAPAAEALLVGLNRREAAGALAAAAAETATVADAMADLSGSAEYKTEMTAILARRALAAAFRRWEERCGHDAAG